MPTQIIDGFRLNAATPIDSRLVTTGTASRNSMAYKYEGLRVYDTIQKTPFVYINGNWEEESTKAVITTSGSVTNMQMNGSENYIPKITSYGTTNSIIREYIATGNTRRIGINVPNTTPITATLHVIGSSLFDGQVTATNFVGKISGNDVQFPVNVDKLNNPNTTGTYVLKSINNTNQWVAETTGSKIVISKNTTDEKLFLVLAKDIDTTGVGNQLYINNNNTSDSLAVNASTRQIMAGTSNTYAKPQYSFIDTTGTGMYGNSTEIGLSMDGNKRIYVSTDSVSINIAQINKVKFESTLTTINTATEISGSNTLKVGGTTTLNDSLTVATDKSTTLGGTLTVTNNTQLNGTLNVATGKSTTLGGTLTVSGTSVLNDTLTVASGKSTTLGGTLTVNGNTSISGTNTFTVGTGETTLGGTLTVTGASTLNDTLTVNKTSTLNGNTSITGVYTFTVGTGATTLGGTLEVSGDSTLNGNLTVAGDKTITLTNTKLKALYSSNEFNFVNNDAYNGSGSSTQIYINYRGAKTNGISAYRFHDGKSDSGDGGLTDVIVKGLISNTAKVGSGTTINRVVVGSVNVARDGTHVINKGSGYVQIGVGSTSGIVPVAVVKLKNAMPSANYNVFVSFSHNVNAYLWVCVAEVIDASNFKIGVARTNQSDWSGVLEVSFMAVCYDN